MTNKKEKETILVTSALPYANGPVHLGHLAGVYLPADMYVRYKRLKGDDVIHISGSDEHGVPITITADKEGITPENVVDRYHKMNADAFKACNILFDYYGRTSDRPTDDDEHIVSTVHRDTAQDFFKEIDKKGFFVKKTEKQFFDPVAGRFLSDRYVTGTCPICKAPGANGDQCEQCGSHLSPTELLDPKSKLSDATPELLETLHWYFRLGYFQNQLTEYVNEHDLQKIPVNEFEKKQYSIWRSNVVNYTKTWLNKGLVDRAITRDLSWGIPVPLDSEEAEGKVLYVWFDAVLGYISFTKEWAKQQGDTELWRHYWQNPETRIINFIGKDNVVFHTLMFPAILMAWNKDSNDLEKERETDHYNLAENVPASEFMNFEGRKFSKSRNYAVYLGEFLERFPADTLRYSIAMNYPENKDTDFSWSDFQNRTNGELADTLGNFIKRAIDFTNSKFDKKVPWDYGNNGEQFLNNVFLRGQIDDIGRAYENFHFREAVSMTMDIAREANRYLTQNEPWKIIKTNSDGAARFISVCLNVCQSLSILFYPIIPETCDKIRNMLGCETIEQLRKKLKPGESIWDMAKTPFLPTGHPLLGSSEILFTKIEEKDIEPEMKKIEALLAEAEQREAAEKPAPMTFKPEITFDDFQKVDLRVATVIACEPVKKANKLLKLQLQVGSEERQVLSGIAQHFTPEEMVGKNVVLVANLADRTMRGELSQGMILAVEGADGRLFLLEPQGEDINGNQVS
ncbi:MAG: methionine--tRNA ligase [Chlorobaculum sp.]|nr:methionine--tRNA ligase [Chlorobaculum sp.]